METPLLPRPLPSRTSKALTARILKRLDDGQPLVEVARKRPLRACSHKSMIWREDSVSCNPLSQFSRTPSRPSKRSLTLEEWERNEHLLCHEPPIDSHDFILLT